MHMSKQEYLAPVADVIFLATIQETLGSNNSRNGQGEDLGDPSRPGGDWGSLFG